MEGRLLHPAHEHALLRRELWKECSVVCSLCGFRSGGVAYCCLDCKFFLGESCISIETPLQLQHPTHLEHPLALEFDEGKCVYRCSSCRFDLPPVIAIATLPPAEQATEESLEVVLHLDYHEHPLNSFKAKMDLPANCRVCRELICRGTFYWCSRGCMFMLHKECVHLPEEILQHPFHPEHPLTFAKFSGKFDCKVCNDTIKSSSKYGCTECGIYYHPKCAAWALVSQDEEEAEIEHFSHEHKLTSFHQKHSHLDWSCAVCLDPLDGESLCCIKCRLFLHKSCLEELPPQIVHYAHPNHPLVLQPNLRPYPYSYCSICDHSSSPIMFECGSCEFRMDPDCALPTMYAVEDDEVAAEIQYPAHGHPLALRSGSWSRNSCHACDERIDGLTYGCNECRFEIHRSCAELPLEWQHPLHPPHPILLNMSSAEPSSCSLCQRKSKGFSFSCTECKFYLDINCAKRLQTFKHPRHEHYLTTNFDEGLTKDLLCNSCGQSYGDGKHKFYRCLSCNFNLHEYCLLDLPTSVERECHPYHPLVLMDKFVDGLPEYQYCDYCVEIRNPDHGVYRCAECWYTVHIDCVVPPEPLNDPILDELDKKIRGLKKKIQVMYQEIEESSEELYAAEQERDARASEARRMKKRKKMMMNNDDEDDKEWRVSLIVLLIAMKIMTGLDPSKNFKKGCVCQSEVPYAYLNDITDTVCNLKVMKM